MVLTIIRRGGTRLVEISIVRELIQLRSSLRFSADGEGLVAEAFGTPLFDFERPRPVTLNPFSDNGFYADHRSARCIAFITNAAGKLAGAVLNPGRWGRRGRGETEIRPAAM